MIEPDKTYKVNAGELELYFNGAYDTIHYYPQLDVHWVRYQDPDTNELQIVVLKEETAMILLEKTTLPYVFRETIFESEHERIAEVLGRWLIGSELDFEVEDE